MCLLAGLKLCKQISQEQFSYYNLYYFMKISVPVSLFCSDGYIAYVWRALFVFWDYSMFLKNSLPLFFLWIDLHQMLKSKAYLSSVVQMVLVLQRWGCKFDVLELSHTCFSTWILSFIPSSSLPAFVLIRKLSFLIRFINREGIDFSDAQSMQAVQVLPVGISDGDSWRNFDA